jgi:hypothetical protein
MLDKSMPGSASWCERRVEEGRSFPDEKSISTGDLVKGPSERLVGVNFGKHDKERMDFNPSLKFLGGRSRFFVESLGDARSMVNSI